MESGTVEGLREEGRRCMARGALCYRYDSRIQTDKTDWGSPSVEDVYPIYNSNELRNL